MLKDRSVQWRDGADSYGWLSIILHWITAIGVVTLLFLGDTLGRGGLPILRLHTSIAMLLLPLIVIRTYWRVGRGHPRPGPRQRRSAFRLGKLLHFVLLAAIATMFVTGPLTAWTGGLPIHLFDVTVLGGSTSSPAAGFGRIRALHVLGAQVIVFGTLIHVAAVLKHMIFDKDGTFGRIMVPGVGHSAPRYAAESSEGGRSERA